MIENNHDMIAETYVGKSFAGVSFELKLAADESDIVLGQCEIERVVHTHSCAVWDD
jgi:hypothetical protein